MFIKDQKKEKTDAEELMRQILSQQSSEEQSIIVLPKAFDKLNLSTEEASEIMRKLKDKEALSPRLLASISRSAENVNKQRK